MAPNTSHIRSHKHGLQDHPWELTWPCPLPLSAGVCPEQTGPLSIGNSGGLRSCCLAGAEGAAGCQWSVPAGASGNGVTLTNLPPILTPTSYLVQGPGAEVEKRTALLRQSSWTRCHGWAHSGRRPNKRRARPPWSLSCLHEVSLRAGTDRAAAAAAHNPAQTKPWDFWGSTKARVMTERVETFKVCWHWNCQTSPKKHRGSSGVKDRHTRKKQHVVKSKISLITLITRLL